MATRAPIGCIAGFSVVFAAAPLCAQSDTVSPNSIIVSGERLNQALEETASSVVVTSRNDLARQPDVDRLDSILEEMPNVTLGSGGQGPTIRGQDTTGVLRDLPAFLGGNRPRTTLIIDGRPASYNEFVFGTQPLWDVDRIEVFRSPQTTTQGRNSISGAIFLETAKPEHEFAGSVRTIAANYDTLQLSALLTGPLVKDQVAFRIAADRRRSETTSELSGGGHLIDPNRDDYDLVRAKLLLTPTAAGELSVDTSFVHMETQSPQVVGIREPYRERRDSSATYGIFRTNVDSLTIRPKWSFDAATSLDALASFGWAETQRYARPGLGQTQIKQNDSTFEGFIRHVSSGIGYVAGLSYNRVSLDQSIDVTAVGLGIGNFTDRQSSFGLFGETLWTPHARISLTLGARYQHDRQLRVGALRSPSFERPLDFDGKYSWFLPKASIAYDISDYVRIGVLVQRAANPGGTTLVADTGGIDIFADETLWDFELFLRGSSGSGTVRYAANLFQYDMRDAQRSVTRSIETPGGTFFLVEIGNVPKAWSRGAELQLSWQPSNKLELAGSIGLLDTRIVEAPDPDDPLNGKQFQRSPHITGSMSATWRPTRVLSLNLSYSGRSGYFDDDLDTPWRRIAGTQVVNMRGSWSNEKLKVFAYVRNLFNRFYVNSIAINRLATAGDPRQFGLGVEAEF